MKLIFDISAVQAPLTGIGRYSLQLAQGLESQPQVEDIRFFSSNGWVESLDAVTEQSSRVTNGSLTNIKSIIKKNLPFKGGVRKVYHQYINQRFRRDFNCLTEYIYHSPNYHLMPFSGQSVVTIHDLSFLRHPEFHPKERVDFWQNEIHRVVNRASHVITDSEFQRQEIVELLNIAENKVSPVHLGVESKFKSYAEQDCNEVLQKYGLRYKEFCLVVATIEPRKNFKRLLKAFESLPSKLRKSYPLAITGDKGWLSEDIHLAIDKLVEKREAVRIGYINDEELPYLYSASSIFLYPSLYEGFGLPVLEAMAAGTAVLTSKTTSIPEVAGDACVVIDPLSTEDMVAEWTSLLESDERRNIYAEKGRKRAQHFSWQKCTQDTLDVYSTLG